MTRFGTQNRSFNASYYNQHEWLEYSISKDAVYCFACRNYSSGANDNCIDSFTQAGFKNWKKVSCYFLNSIYLYIIYCKYLLHCFYYSLVVQGVLWEIN